MRTHEQEQRRRVFNIKIVNIILSQEDIIPWNTQKL